MGGGPPPIGGNPHPRRNGPRQQSWNWFRGERGSAHRRAIIGSASRRHRGVGG
jgi:hypothetical protein